MEAALVVLDGWGLGDHDQGPTGSASGPDSRGPSGGRDAVRAADTPAFDRLAAVGAAGTLDVSGRRVGLPDGQMGNSEVGHLNLGAGRVVKQAYTRISDAVAAWRGDRTVEDPEPFGDNDALAGALAHAATNEGRVHLVGLVSDGGVHSDQDHLHALIELAAERGVDAVTHAITDGRDTPPRAGAKYLADLEAAVEERGTGDVATVVGRYYAMDRDANWERTRRAYDAVVNRDAPHEARSAVDAVEAAYARDEGDEFVEPTLVTGGPALADGDAVVWFNFRADRARQLVRMLGDVDPEWGFGTDPPDAHLVMMTEYDREFPFPVAFPPDEPEDTLGDVLARTGRTQLRAAESEKYPHVTYFLNGGREVEFAGETRVIVDSPDVPTYDLRPEMSAGEVTDRVEEHVERDDPDVVVVNYANPDMVGHTGDFEAAVAAVEAVDRELGRLADVVRAAGGHLLVTADHGNADDMGTPEDPHTAHTANPVPFVHVAPGGEMTGDADLSSGYAVRSGGSLCDVAPTLLALIGVERPAAMTGQSLLRPR
ncbi:MAG: 2,3-bisphosphoglycerate-independent phosphoglycerate mutase [Haloferacaceae archaeon]